jgi:membrane protein
MERLLKLKNELVRFVRLLFARFGEDHGMAHAASLTYATLLALVPLMTVSLALLSAFPISGRVAELLQNFIFENFVPASGEVVQTYLQQFSEKAGRLSGAGFVFLVIVALMLMAEIERSLNTIWRVRKKRSPVAKFVVYWSILSLGPLLMGGSVVVTSYLASLPTFSGAVETIGMADRLLGIAPLLASMGAFTLLYTVVPNRYVPFRHALAGGVVAAILFEWAKKGFALYLTQFPTYEAIYGAVAVAPIFLVWVYLSWAVTLLGAEFSCCLGIVRDDLVMGELDGRNDLVLALRLLAQLWQAQRDGRTLSTERLVRRLGRVSEEGLGRLLLELHAARLVLRTEEGEWGLARDLSGVTLLELYQLRPFMLPPPALLRNVSDPAEQRLGEVLQQVESDLEVSFGVSLETLLTGEEQPPPDEGGGEAC